MILLSEARGEFVSVERVREGLAHRGIVARHLTALGSDLQPEEAARSGVDVLDRQPEYVDAMKLAGLELAEAIDREEQTLGLNLRRVWQADLRSWREHWPDERMARIAVGYARALRRIFEEEDPVGVWGEDGGHLLKQLGYALCRDPRPQLWFLWAGPLPGRAVLYSDVLASNRKEDLQRFVPTAEEKSYAADFIESVRESRVQYAIPRDMTMHPRRISNFAHLLVRRYATRPPGADSLHPWRFAQLFLRQRRNAARLRRTYRAVGERPFVFYPVHVAHDTQISVRAHQWQNQLALIEHIAASLPFGYELAIKEHPFQVGALPPGELRALLRRRPEIRLLDADIHAHSIIARCAALATINSTAGFEALFFGRPVITFGHSSYRGLGLTFDVVDAFDTPTLLAAAVRSGGPDPDEVVRFVSFLHRRSMLGFPLSEDLSEENLDHYVDRLAHEFTRALQAGDLAAV